MSRTARWGIGLFNAVLALPFLYILWANGHSTSFLRDVGFVTTGDTLETGGNLLYTGSACAALGACLAVALGARCAWVWQRAVAYAMAANLVWSGVEDYVQFGYEDLADPGAGWYVALMVAVVAVPYGLSVALRRSALRFAIVKGAEQPAA